MKHRFRKLMAMLLSTALCLTLPQATLMAGQEGPENPKVPLQDVLEEAEETVKAAVQNEAEPVGDVSGGSVEDRIVIDGKLPVQVVFVLDRSGSMGDEIDKVKGNIKAFLDHLNEFSLRDGTKLDPHIGIVDYSDIDYAGSDPAEAAKVHTFADGSHWSNSGNELYEHVDGIRLTWGGDYEETSTEAMQYLLRDDWGWKDGQRFVFLITDATSKDFKDSFTKNELVKDMSEIVKGFTEQNIITSVVTRTNLRSDYSELFNTTHGKFYDINKPFDFAELFEEVMKFTITADAGEHGLVTVESDDWTSTVRARGGYATASREIEFGKSATYTVIPDDTYYIEDLKLDGETVAIADPFKEFSGTISNVQRNHSITVTFNKKTTYNVTVNVSGNGTVDKPGVTTVNPGETFKLTATPGEALYAVDKFVINPDTEKEEVTFGDAVEGTEARFIEKEIYDDTVINVNFIDTAVTVTLIGAPSGNIVYRKYLVDDEGKTSSSKYEYDDRLAGTAEGEMETVVVRLAKGSSALFDVFAYNGCEVKDVIIDGEVDPYYSETNQAEMGSDGEVNDTGRKYVTFESISENHTLSATFKDIDITQYEVGVTVKGAGQVSVNGMTIKEGMSLAESTLKVNQGKSLDFTIISEVPNGLVDVRDNDFPMMDKVVSQNETTYTYTMENIAENHGLVVEFDDDVIEYPIYIDAGDGGDIYATVSGGDVRYSNDFYVSENSTVVFEVRPNTDYVLSTLELDGADIYERAEKFRFAGDDVDSFRYILKDVKDEHVISATFAAKINFGYGDDFFIDWTKSVSYNGKTHVWTGSTKPTTKNHNDISITLWTFDGQQRKDVTNLVKDLKVRNTKVAHQGIKDDKKSPYFTIVPNRDAGADKQLIRYMKKYKFVFNINPANLETGGETVCDGNPKVKGSTVQFKNLAFKPAGLGDYSVKLKWTKNEAKSDYAYNKIENDTKVEVVGKNNFVGTVVFDLDR